MNPYSSHTNSGFLQRVPTQASASDSPVRTRVPSVSAGTLPLSAPTPVRHIARMSVHSQSRRNPDDMSRQRQRRNLVAQMAGRAGGNSGDCYPGYGRSDKHANGCHPLHRAGADGEQYRQWLAGRVRDRGAQQQIDRAMQPQSGQHERPRCPATAHGACAGKNPEFGAGKGKEDPCQHEEKAEGGQGPEVPLVVTLEPVERDSIKGYPADQGSDPQAEHHRALFLENPNRASDSDQKSHPYLRYFREAEGPAPHDRLVYSGSNIDQRQRELRGKYGVGRHAESMWRACRLGST